MEMTPVRHSGRPAEGSGAFDSHVFVAKGGSVMGLACASEFLGHHCQRPLPHDGTHGCDMARHQGASVMAMMLRLPDEVLEQLRHEAGVAEEWRRILRERDAIATGWIYRPSPDSEPNA